MGRACVRATELTGFTEFGLTHPPTNGGLWHGAVHGRHSPSGQKDCRHAPRQGRTRHCVSERRRHREHRACLNPCAFEPTPRPTGAKACQCRQITVATGAHAHAHAHAHTLSTRTEATHTHAVRTAYSLSSPLSSGVGGGSCARHGNPNCKVRRQDADLDRLVATMVPPSKKKDQMGLCLSLSASPPPRPHGGPP